VKHIPPKRWWHKSSWELVEDLNILWHTVPAGFVTDGVSTPMLLIWLVSPTGKAMRAAVLHDYKLSQLHPCESRAEADKSFYWAMKHCGIHPVRAFLMFLAVRVYGIAKVWWYRLWH